MKQLTYKGIDVMKLCKDNVNNQLSDADILSVVTAIKNGIHPTHISLSVPMDTDAQFRAHGTIPAPRTITALQQKWADTIHQAGLNVIWRGTFSGIEGIWNFPNATYGTSNYLPLGTATSAPTDGETTWLGKIYRFLTSNPTFFADGDLFAPIAEPTNFIFNSATNWVNPTNENVNLFQFFQDIDTVARAFFAANNLAGVGTGFTTNNYSEVNSGYIPQTYFDYVKMTVFDDYGTDGNHRSVAELQGHIESAFSAKGYQVFQQEWSDYWNGSLTTDQRLVYLKKMYDMETSEQLAGRLVGYSYWGGWTTLEGVVESILYKDANGNYQVNGRGKFLGSYYNAQGGLGRLPVVDSNGNY